MIPVKLSWLLAFVTFISIATISSGCQVILTNSVKASVTQLVRERLPGYKLPTFSGNGYEVKNGMVRSVSLGTTRVALRSGKLRITIDDAAISASTDWKVWKRIRILWAKITLRKSGSLTASASNIDISQTVKMKFINGLPVISADSCTASIGNLSVRVENTSFKWVLNLILRVIRGRFKDKLEEQICPLIARLLRDHQAALSRKINDSIKLIG